MPDQRYAEPRNRPRLIRQKKRGNEDPRMIGQWKIGKTIGKGSSGRVKVARHAKTNRYAAIKIVSKSALFGSRISMSDAPAHAEKVLLGIEREIVIMKLIDHPNVLNLYDVWETGNELYLIMEYVEGGELFDYLVSRGRLPIEEALHYFQQIIAAVSYCHSFNIAHRDLKPENLLLSKSGSGRNIKVADFGMAAYTDPAAMLLTSCGSPHYASPEVVEGRAYKGNVSDIWSCGVILYALLAGRLPFDDENLRILLEKVKIAKFEIPSDIPAPAQDLLSRMLEKDVTRRITMPQILSHPFFLSTTPSPFLRIDARALTLSQLSSGLEKPVKSEEDIDADIFDNLRTLWHGDPATEIIKRLLNDEKTWEKAVYHLLLKYRSKRLENYNTDEDDGDLEKRRMGQRGGSQDTSLAGDDALNLVGQVSGDGEYEDGADESTPITRPSAPTPQRALIQAQEVTVSTPGQKRTVSNPSSPGNLPNQNTGIFTTTPRRGKSTASHGPLPLLPPRFTIRPTADGSAVSNVGKASPIAPKDIQVDSNVLVHIASLSSPPSSQLLPIDVPSVPDADQTVQRFFRQIVGGLNTMQMREVQSSTISSRSATPHPGSSVFLMSLEDSSSMSGAAVTTNGQIDIPASPATPSPTITELHTDDGRFQDAAEDIEISLHANDHTSSGWGILGRNDAQSPPASPAPPFGQSQKQGLEFLPSSGRTYKTVVPGKNAAITDTSLHASNKENANVWKDEGRPGAKIRKKSSLRKTHDGRKTLGDRHVQIILPPDVANEVTVKKRKSILSTRSTETSPALSDGSFFLPEGSSPRTSWFGNFFHLKPASYSLLSVHDSSTTKEECARLLGGFGVSVLAHSDSMGVLKCRLEEVKGPAGVMAVAKAVRFRVELHAVAQAHSVVGYLSSLTMVQEKGALSSFRLIYNRLRREWTLDTPPTRIQASKHGPLATNPALAPTRFP